MRRSREILVLLALLVGAMAFVLWYVVDRRARNRVESGAARPAARTLAPAPAAPEVVLGTDQTERKTIDFSSGRPVVKDTPEDRAALDAALKDIHEATQTITIKFEPAPANATPHRSAKNPGDGTPET